MTTNVKLRIMMGTVMHAFRTVDAIVFECFGAPLANRSSLSLECQYDKSNAPYPTVKIDANEAELLSLKEQFNKFFDECIEALRSKERSFDDLTPEEKEKIKEHYFNEYRNR